MTQMQRPLLILQGRKPTGKRPRKDMIGLWDAEEPQGEEYERTKRTMVPPRFPRKGL